MTKDKQIDEMWKDIASTPIGPVKDDLTLTEMGEVYKAEFIGRIAKHLYTAGYRKASEIFEEIARIGGTSCECTEISIDENGCCNCYFPKSEPTESEDAE